MENYDEFFRNAKVITQVHARPTKEQKILIEQHLKASVKEEQK